MGCAKHTTNEVSATTGGRQDRHVEASQGMGGTEACEVARQADEDGAEELGMGRGDGATGRRRDAGVAAMVMQALGENWMQNCTLVQSTK